MKKKALAAVLVAAVTMSMAGCGSKQAASTDGGSKTESEAGSDAAAVDSGEKKTLRVGMECAYAPYNWTQSDDPTEPFRFQVLLIMHTAMTL